ncbi:pyocin knob domain-containing S74 family peptidase [Atlantibacter hermannii]|uniref:pyocin knob domain-containing S74 family peptidase n=1 Tax=Atlantibacter hermannii TaxID=565 RepID=UPI0028B15F7D|nr:pyocin knob domain-containing S74 family peptidase [Atlantibacter hermannii]
MSAGTLKLTNNSTAVVGTSTLFTTDLKPGDFITATIGGVLYTLPVDSVTSNTAATLVSPFTGPTTAGAAWAAVPRKTMNQVPAELVTQSTEALRGLLAEKGVWTNFYTAPGDISVQLSQAMPAVTGPGWQKMAGLVSSSQQWRGNLPAAANLNAYGPTPDFTGTWNRSSNTNTTAAYGFPEDNGQGILEVFAGGRYGGMQRYTVSMNGNVYVRSLTGAWNGADGPWSDWSPAGIQTRMSFFTGDLNTLKAPGEWSVTTPFSGGPTDVPGICEVIPRLNGTGLLQRYTAIATGAAGINRTWQRTLSGITWSEWDPVGIKPLNDLGIGIPNSTLSGLDWQTFSFVNGAAYQLNAANWLNAPAPLDTYTTGTFALNVTNVSGDVTASTGNAWIHFTATYYSAGLSRRIYQGVFRGPVGARVYHIEEIFTDSRVIPVANGGTGATTPGSARSALQLGDSATKNVGTGAGTVAAGDDYRIKDAASVKGAGFTGVIDFLNYTTSGDPGEAIILRAAHGVSNPGEFYNNFWKAFAPDGSFSRMQHYTTSYHSIRMVIAGVTGGTGVFTFGQTGTAIASNAWVNSGSDERIKDDIRPVENPRDILMNVRAATWKFKHRGAEGRFGIGVIANDIAKYFPNAVFNTGSRELDDGTVIDDVLAVEAGDSGAMVAVHHAVLQSLVEENRTQQLEIEALKSDMEELKKMVEGFITK